MPLPWGDMSPPTQGVGGAGAAVCAFKGALDYIARVLGYDKFNNQ
jgi:hypothetical protein